MLLSLLVFPFSPLIIGCLYFIVLFIVSRNLFCIYLYDLCIIQVSRLIFNLLEANCPLDESIYADTTENFTCYRPEPNRDTEAGTSLEAGREPFLGEETYEEER